jgi:hypothetical protein
MFYRGGRPGAPAPAARASRAAPAAPSPLNNSINGLDLGSIIAAASSNAGARQGTARYRNGDF